jgi:hypothetical protein
MKTPQPSMRKALRETIDANLKKWYVISVVRERSHPRVK